MRDSSFSDLDTSQLLNQKINTRLNWYLERLQSSTWDRCLIKTQRDSRLAQKGDLIYIIIGCSVSVGMREIPESKPLEHQSDSSSSQQSLLNELGTNHSTSVAKTVIRCQIIGELLHTWCHGRGSTQVSTG
jgi:hypothetical protein